MEMIYLTRGATFLLFGFFVVSWINCANAQENDPSSTPGGPFADLSRDEMQQVIGYLHQQTIIPLVKYEDAGLADASLFLIESYRPAKVDCLNYLDNGGDLPERAARVIILRGDLSPPVVEEYRVSPIPNPSKFEKFQNPKWKDPIPFNTRSPENGPENDSLYEEAEAAIGGIDHILREMTGGWSFGNCSEKCLMLNNGFVQNYPRPEKERAYTFFVLRDVEGSEVHPIGVQFLYNNPGVNTQQWGVEYVWIQGQEFANFSEVQAAYNAGELMFKTVPDPEFLDTKKLRSSLHFRGDPLPTEPKRGPETTMPDGHRMDVIGRRVKWQGWEFEFAMLTSSGLQVFDIRFLGQRIAYEISLQEAATFYSGGTPWAQHTNIFDSTYIFGQKVSQLFRGIDCPHYAKFFDFVVFSGGEAATYINGACLFEHNRGIPLRRHYQEHNEWNDGYGQGMPDNTLVLRQIFTVYNYDFIVDVMFHQAGQIEGKISLSGHVLSHFYNGDEAMLKYGNIINEPTTLGPIHHHFANFKVDLDIMGTGNRLETLDIKVENISDPINPGKRLLNRYFDHSLKKTELEGAYQYNFSTPKYIVVYNEQAKNKFGHSKGYRVVSEAMSKNLFPMDHSEFPTQAWTHYQVAVTKHKESERSSRSVYDQMSTADPVFTFHDYINDDDNIIDQDLVLWVTLGTQHIPHSEDVPIVNTLGTQLTFFLLPYNYFDEDPSLASRDNIWVTLTDNPTDTVYQYAGVPAPGSSHSNTVNDNDNDNDNDDDDDNRPCNNVITNAAKSNLLDTWLLLGLLFGFLAMKY